jgi:hypothetical protein
MKYLAALLILLLLGGCSRVFIYDLATPSNSRNIPADSLKWKYDAGVLSEIVVRNSNDEVMRLRVTPGTTLDVVTTENIEHNFDLQSLVVQDNGEGLLGSNTAWRGYDQKQGAQRTVLVREIATIKVWSMIPAYARINVK